MDTIPGSQAVLVPPSSFGEIEDLRRAGWEGVAFNLEVWDPALWPGIVPGKAAEMSQDKGREALEYAVGIFGKGNVTSVLIAGMEPKKSHWAGVEWLAQRGIYGVPIPGARHPALRWRVIRHPRPLGTWKWSPRPWTSGSSTV